LTKLVFQWHIIGIFFLGWFIMTVAPWRASSVQMLSDLAVTAPDKEAAWAVIRGNLDRAVKLIEDACAGQDQPRLFVLPEFAFQGAPHDMGVAAWIDLACYPVPGPITEPLQHLAQRLGVYIGGNQFETTPQWPGRYFNTSFLIDPAGKIVLRYRRFHGRLPSRDPSGRSLSGGLDRVGPAGHDCLQRNHGAGSGKNHDDAGRRGHSAPDQQSGHPG
jgi:hypothetical protein